MKRQIIDGIEFKDLSFSYDKEEFIFRNFNFSLGEDRIIYIHGPKGSGKNTFLKILIGLLPPTKGDFLINGVRVNDFSHHDFDSFRLNMGFAFDIGGLINNQTIYENFRFVLDYHDYLESTKRFEYIVELLKVFNLDEKKHLRPSAVSPSDRKAAVILRSLILKPELLILDNPTQGLSKEHLPKLVELISEHMTIHGLKHAIISSEDRNILQKMPGKNFKVTVSGLVEEKETGREVA